MAIELICLRLWVAVERLQRNIWNPLSRHGWKEKLLLWFVVKLRSILEVWKNVRDVGLMINSYWYLILVWKKLLCSFHKEVWCRDTSAPGGVASHVHHPTEEERWPYRAEIAEVRLHVLDVGFVVFLIVVLLKDEIWPSSIPATPAVDPVTPDTLHTATSIGSPPWWCTVLSHLAWFMDSWRGHLRVLRILIKTIIFNLNMYVHTILYLYIQKSVLKIS